MRALVILAALLLVAAPVVATEPGIYVSPYIPQAVIEAAPVPGQTLITTMVWTGTRWAQQSFVVVPTESMAAECTTLPGGPKA